MTNKDAGQPVNGNVRFDLPEGMYEIRSYSPETGLYSPGVKINGAKNLKFTLPELKGDIVLRITKLN